MPSIISHAAVPIALGLGLGTSRIPLSLLAVGIVVAMLPDADVIMFRFGATYDDSWSHRGFSHSLASAGIIGLLAAAVLRQHVRPLSTFLFVTLAMASHGLLDMFTNGGHGVAYLWPFSDARFFAWERPIQVSPIDFGRFAARAERVIATELIWIWLPAMLVAAALRLGLPTGATPSSTRRRDA